MVRTHHDYTGPTLHAVQQHQVSNVYTQFLEQQQHWEKYLMGWINCGGDNITQRRIAYNEENRTQMTSYLKERA